MCVLFGFGLVLFCTCVFFPIFLLTSKPGSAKNVSVKMRPRPVDIDQPLEVVENLPDVEEEEWEPLAITLGQRIEIPHVSPSMIAFLSSCAVSMAFVLKIGAHKNFFSSSPLSSLSLAPSLSRLAFSCGLIVAYR